MTKVICTTLNRIRAQHPCANGWSRLLAGLGKTKADDEPLPYARVVEINGFDDAIWAFRAEPHYNKEWWLFAVWCARQVEHLIKDGRICNALNVAERYANGQATNEELAAAWAASNAASYAARSAALAASYAERDAAWAASNAARSAAWATSYAEEDAAWAASNAASYAASYAARSAAWAAGYAERDAEEDAAWAASNAARDAQIKKFLEIVGE